MADKTRADGNWTESKFVSFIKSQLRGGSMKWPPRNKVIQEARKERGVYLCNCCNALVPATIKDPKSSGRIKNVFVDHVSPIVDPAEGFSTWDRFIDGLFCDSTNLQLLCKKCHDIKSAEERRVATERRKNNK